MPGGIWEAIGAALQAGGQTYNQVSQQKLREKQVAAELALRQQGAAEESAYRNQQMEFARNAEQRAMEDRKIKQLQDAIAGANPGDDLSSFVPQIRQNAPFLMTQLQQNPGGFTTNVQDGLPAALGGKDAVGPAITVKDPTFSRKANLAEQQQQLALERQKQITGSLDQLTPDQKFRLNLSQIPGVNVSEVLPPQARPLSQQSEGAVIERFRKQWDGAHTQTKELARQFNLMEQGLNRYDEDPMGASQAVLVTFQKILDPNSVVRESEYARTGQNMSIAQRIEGTLEKAISGGAGVPKEQLAAMVETARQFMSSAPSGVDGLRARIERNMQRYNIPSELVFDDVPNDSGAGAPKTAPQGSVGAKSATTDGPPPNTGNKPEVVSMKQLIAKYGPEVAPEMAAQLKATGRYQIVRDDVQALSPETLRPMKSHAPTAPAQQNSLVPAATAQNLRGVYGR